ncbi:hypothetical protein Plhal304r1_c001g0001781 [Plasmopara halstedii]
MQNLEVSKCSPAIRIQFENPGKEDNACAINLARRYGTLTGR